MVLNRFLQPLLRRLSLIGHEPPSAPSAKGRAGQDLRRWQKIIGPSPGPAQKSPYHYKRRLSRGCGKPGNSLILKANQGILPTP